MGHQFAAWQGDSLALRGKLDAETAAHGPGWPFILQRQVDYHAIVALETYVRNALDVAPFQSPLTPPTSLTLPSAFNIAHDCNALVTKLQQDENSPPGGHVPPPQGWLFRGTLTPPAINEAWHLLVSARNALDRI